MAVTSATSTISRSVNAYQSSFTDLEEAADMRWQLEDRVRSGLSALEQTLQSINAWRKRVREGCQEFSDRDDQDYRNVLSRWVDFTRFQALPRVDQYEETYGYLTVSASQELRMRLIQAQDTLKNWESPVPSRYASVRHANLTDAESRALVDAVLAQAAQPPRRFRRIEHRQP